MFFDFAEHIAGDSGLRDLVGCKKVERRRRVRFQETAHIFTTDIKSVLPTKLSEQVEAVFPV